MSIVEQAKDELKRANFGEDDTKVMVEILEKFFDQWDSGGAVYAMAPVLQRLIAGKPITPLSGNDDEWLDHGNDVFQNIRCSTVFKEKDVNGNWFTYDIERKPDKASKRSKLHRWGRNGITFPYWPTEATVSSPVVEFGT